MDREALAELEATLGRAGGERLDRRPRPLWPSGSDRFGGAWMVMRGPSTTRAVATAARYSSRPGSGSRCIAVPGFGRKFCTMTSCTCRYRRWSSRIANSDSARSRALSPIPMSTPVVNGIASRPASSIVRSRTAGTLSGEPTCGPPRRDRRSEEVSSISPIEALTCLSRASSS
jgi:hypothetical protein